MVSARIPAVMAPDGVIVSDQELKLPQAQTLPLPPGVQAGRYFMYLWPRNAG